MPSMFSGLGSKPHSGHSGFQKTCGMARNWRWEVHPGTPLLIRVWPVSPVGFHRPAGRIQTSRVCHHFEGIKRTLLLLVVIEKHLRRKIHDRFENHPLGPQLTFPVCPPSDSTAVGLVFVLYCLLSLKQHKDPIYKSTSANVHHPSHPSHPKTPGCRTMR